MTNKGTGDGKGKSNGKGKGKSKGKSKSNGKCEMPGSLHYATDDGTVRCFGRDDALYWLVGEQADANSQGS